MKILLIADIHANWPALAAIREPFDACLFLGDAVDYGTDPVPCIEWLRQHASACVRGNHDHAVAQRVPARGGSGLKELAAASRPLHWDVLRRSQMQFLGRLPVTRRLTLDGKQFYLVHATPRDPMDEYLGENADAWRARLENVEADFVCVGHTHVPYQLDLERTRVINPGSVGQPRDGDPRCSYGVIENGAYSLRRVAYDIDATLRQMRQAGVDKRAVELADVVLRTGGRAPGDKADG